MDLDRFIEKDIIEFLEKKASNKQSKIAELEELETEKSFTPKKNFGNLLEQALAANQVNDARRVFDEAQKELENALTDKDREGYNSLVEELYTKIQQFSKQEKNKPILNQQNKEFESNKNQTNSQNTKSSKKETSNESKKETKEQNLSLEAKDKIKVRSQIKQTAIRISDYLRKHNLKAAMNEYKLMKKYFALYPKTDHKGKDAMFNDLVASYYQIKKLEEETKNEVTEKDIAQKKELEEKLEDIKHKTLYISKKIKVFLGAEDYTKAAENYEQLKELFILMPKNAKKERKLLYNHVLKVYNGIKSKLELEKKKNPELKISADLLDKPSSETINKTEEEKNTDGNFAKQGMKLKSEIKEIISLMKQKDIHQANLKLMEVKHEVESLTDNKKYKKEQFEHVLSEISHRINFLKHSMEIKENVR